MSSHILAHLRGRLPETSRRRSGEWRPAVAARNRRPREARDPARQALRPGCEEVAALIRRKMPEKEARPPAQNRHGGAPRGERVPLDARRASPGADRRAPKRATTEIVRLSALRSPLMGWMEKRNAKPGRSNAPRERERLWCWT